MLALAPTQQLVCTSCSGRQVKQHEEPVSAIAGATWEVFFLLYSDVLSLELWSWALLQVHLTSTDPLRTVADVVVEEILPSRCSLIVQHICGRGQNLSPGESVFIVCSSKQVLLYSSSISSWF